MCHVCCGRLFSSLASGKCGEWRVKASPWASTSSWCMGGYNSRGCNWRLSEARFGSVRSPLRGLEFGRRLPPAASARFFGATSCCQHPRVANVAKKFSTLPDLCVSSLRRGHANLLCIVPILTDDPRRESVRARIPFGRLVRLTAAETRYKERGSKPTGFDGCVRVFPRLMSLVNNGNKKRILKPAARAGGRTVPSHNLSCTACHSYLGTQLQVKACHHTPKKLWNRIHVHRASHCSLNFENAVRAAERSANQAAALSGGVGW